MANVLNENWKKSKEIGKMQVLQCFVIKSTAETKKKRNLIDKILAYWIQCAEGNGRKKISAIIQNLLKCESWPRGKMQTETRGHNNKEK